MADVDANRALAEAFISRQLGFGLKELRDPRRALKLAPVARVRFKRYKNHVDQKVLVSVIVALRAARAVVRSVDRLVHRFAGPQKAQDIRNWILRRSEFVDLDSLLEFCWEFGIPAFQLAHTPVGSKRFDGMAAFVERRPVIALASGRDGAPWLAFYVAHELGHIMLRHVRADTGAWIDGSLAGAAGASSHELEADRFACEVLTGFSEPTIPNLKLNAPSLAARAAKSGPRQGVDPGILALIYARSNDRWGAAQNALKHLGVDTGGRERVNRLLDQHLSGADLAETDERLLGVLRAA